MTPRETSRKLQCSRTLEMPSHPKICGPRRCAIIHVHLSRLITTTQTRNLSIVRTQHPPIYRANPKSATIPPAKRGVPYSRAMAIAVAAPPVEAALVVAAVAEPAAPLVWEAVLEGEALLEVDCSPLLVRLPHSLSRAVVH